MYRAKAISELLKLPLSKRGSRQNLSGENECYLHETKYYFDINGFALSLTWKQSLEATRKWRHVVSVTDRVSPW